MNKRLPLVENLISRNAEKSIGNLPGHIFKSRMKRINSRYKLIEFLSGRRSSANTVVNLAKAGFRFGAVVLIKILVFNVASKRLAWLVHTLWGVSGLLK